MVCEPRNPMIMLIDAEGNEFIEYCSINHLLYLTADLFQIVVIENYQL